MYVNLKTESGEAQMRNYRFGADSLPSRFLSRHLMVSHAVAFCETTTQFPNPAVVLKDARQRLPEAPPVQFVPAGIWTVSCSEISSVGAWGRW